MLCTSRASSNFEARRSLAGGGGSEREKKRDPYQCIKRIFQFTQLDQRKHLFLISNFHRVLNVLCFLLGNSPAPEFDMPTFRNTLFHLHRRGGAYLPACEDGTSTKRRDIIFRRRGITQKKAYKMQLCQKCLSHNGHHHHHHHQDNLQEY